MSAAAEQNPTTETKPAIVESTEADLYTQANIYLAKQTKPVIIPSFAKWFDINEIHAIEKNSLPDFFSSQSNIKYKNPEIYKTVRDFIINTYRLNPIEYLSITAVRRNIAMDVGSLFRIYGFLSKWGLINYQIDPKTKSFTMGPQFTGHFQITLDKPTGFALQCSEKNVSIDDKNEFDDKKVVATSNDNDDGSTFHKRQKVSNSITPNVKLNLQLRKNVYDSADDAFILQDNSSNNPKQVKRVYCSITGNDITETKYHNLKNKSNISLETYENAQFEDYFKNSDYIKLEKTVLNNDSRPWTNSEVLLLLEGIEMYGDDWNLISGHVGSRAKNQCIVKFIQLPIEDTYLFKRISKSSYIDYLKKLKDNRTIDLSSLLNSISTNGGSISTTTTTNTTVTTTIDMNERIVKHANSELEHQDKLVTSILKLSLRKFELKLQGFMNLESRISEQQKLIETEKENLVLDKMKVKKQCLSVQQQLLKASDIVQAIKGDTTITAEALESAIVEAMGFVDRAISEAKYDPNAASSLIASIKDLDATTKDESKPESKDIDNEKPISMIEPKLYSMWSA